MNKTAWIIFTVFTVGVLGLLIIFSKNSQLDVSAVDVSAIQVANSQDGNIADHVLGKSDGKVTLIEYGDFQCPPCGSAAPRIKIITEQYKNQLRFVFRNFPITTAHANAKAAAGTAEAAGLQGKYWEMHDKIYAAQVDWSNLTGTDRTNFFENYAKDLNLDITKFNLDIASTSVGDKINYDSALGKKAEVNATPTFFLNGVRLDPSVWGDNTKLKDAINAELTKAGIALPK